MRRVQTRVVPQGSTFCRRPAVGHMLALIRKEVARWREPVVTEIARRTQDPFAVLISCILSLRTKDATAHAASRRLFALAVSPGAMARLSAGQIEKAIYPVAFYRVKARTIRALCGRLLDEYGGRVPARMEDLLGLPGVGRKTANLVLIEGFQKRGICVDTHVHRISNRWGYVSTRTPDETEFALRAVLPRRYWKEYNLLLVTFGQHICVPVSPRCSICVVRRLCARVGVVRSR